MHLKVVRYRDVKVGDGVTEPDGTRHTVINRYGGTVEWHVIGLVTDRGKLQASANHLIILHSQPYPGMSEAAMHGLVDKAISDYWLGRASREEGLKAVFTAVQAYLLGKPEGLDEQKAVESPFPLNQKA